MYTPTAYFQEEEGAIAALPLIQDVGKEADVALGVRLLNDAWLTGGVALAVEVERSSDGFQSGIGFDGDGLLDEAALLAWVGTGPNDHGYVVKWWDQSGKGNHFENPNGFSRSPIIVLSGSILRLSGSDDGNGNELPTVFFDGNTSGQGTYLDSPAIPATYDPEISFTADFLSYNSNGIMMSELQNGYIFGTYYQGHFSSANSSAGFFGSSNQPIARLYGIKQTPGDPIATSIYFGRGQGFNTSKIYAVNLSESINRLESGSSADPAAGTGPEFDFTIEAGFYAATSHDNFTIGRYPANPLYQRINISEIIRWSGSAAFDSASRQTCVENMASYYGIPF